MCVSFKLLIHIICSTVRFLISIFFVSKNQMQFPSIDPKDGPYPNRGSCVFAQTSVMRSGTSRDGRQQSRLIRGNKEGFEICTVDHQKDGKVRLDATITFKGDTNEVGVYAHEDEAYDHDQYFKVYVPSAGDALHPPDDGFRRYNADGIIERKFHFLSSSNTSSFGSLNYFLTPLHFGSRNPNYSVYSF